MDTSSDTRSRRDEIITAIGVVALLIGTATGNASAMLVIAMVALAVIAVIYRRRLGRKALLTMLLAAWIGFVATALANV
jgi:hypothetical protein